MRVISGKRQKVILWLVGLVVALPTTGWIGIISLDRVESERAFCISCHLPNGKPLHKAKYDLGQSLLSMDGTAVHFRAKHTPEISCADCHRGTGFAGRAGVIWGSLVNTGRYLFSDYEEPTKLSAPIQDATCLGCHPSDLPQLVRHKFHGIKAHRYPIPVACTDCHLGHGEEDSSAGFLSLESKTIMTVCGQCHDVTPPTAPIQAIVETYRTRRNPTN